MLSGPNKGLKRILFLTLVVMFGLLLAGGAEIYKDQAPIPARVVGPNGALITTKAQILGGQAVWQKYDLMDYGSVLGTGTYIGPDYTTEALHILTAAEQEFYGQQLYGKAYKDLEQGQQAAVAVQVKADLKTNRYDAATGTLTLSQAEVQGMQAVRDHYQAYFANGNIAAALPAGIIQQSPNQANPAHVAPGDQVQQISDFFAWTAWLSVANRPGLDYTYTNNWPYAPESGNQATYSALLWSAVSVVGLIAGVALILWAQKKWKLEMEPAYTKFPRYDLSKLQVTEGQRKLGKYLLILTVLFLLQAGMGAVMAHYYADGTSFYGLNIAQWLPFNIAKSFHLQLAIFWVALGFLAMALYIAPVLAGEEPKHQGLLIDVLFWALVVVVGGSLAGEWLGAKGYLGNLWWWFGNQGWNYLELGRFWQLLLVAGLVLWSFILWRGLKVPVRREKDKGGFVHMLLYVSIAIPVFYLFALAVNPDMQITIADYWRWWIVHLWVEGIFEVFAVVIIGYVMTALKLVTERSTVRALYFQMIILFGSGIVGTGHHYYWTGTPEVWIAIGSVFSALEVIPLTLLVLEAYDQYKIARQGGEAFPYRGAFWFLVATAFWNLVGAGLLGFLINMPFVAYFEHGSWLTVTHAHGAMFGVYGNLALALMLYALRNIVKPKAWNDKWVAWSLWLLNGGLMGMILVTLLPVGFMQLSTSYLQGFYAARDFSFYQRPMVNFAMWIRVVPDTIFLIGILPLIGLAWKGLMNLRPVSKGQPLAVIDEESDAGAAD